MICPPCAAIADYVTAHKLNEGHPADLCRDHGKEIRACGCQHHRQAGEPDTDTHHQP